MSDQAIQLMHGDSRELLKTLPENSVESVVTDPPYMIGFMGKAFDNPKNNIAADPAFWAEVLRVLKPGGHLLSFGGTRTYHRMACAIEDAGFEIRDQIQWLYATGFPKSLNLGEGRGTALKPANEPICLARKPLSESTVAANVLRWGTGGLNIDASRIEGAWNPVPAQKFSAGAGGIMTHNKRSGSIQQSHPQGRWPANVIFSPEAAAELDRQSGILTSGMKKAGTLEKHAGQINFSGPTLSTADTYGDTGGASRFFFIAKPSQAERCAGLDDGNPHPTVKPLELFSYLIRLVTPTGGTVLDPFTGSGSSGMAAVNGGFGFIGMEKEIDYFAIAQSRIRHSKGETGLFAED